MGKGHIEFLNDFKILNMGEKGGWPEKLNDTLPIKIHYFQISIQ